MADLARIDAKIQSGEEKLISLAEAKKIFEKKLREVKKKQAKKRKKNDADGRILAQI